MWGKFVRGLAWPSRGCNGAIAVAAQGTPRAATCPENAQQGIAGAARSLARAATGSSKGCAGPSRGCKGALQGLHVDYKGLRKA